MINPLLRFSVDSQLQNIPLVRTYMERVGRKLALGDEERFHLELVVVEAVTNCISHAYKGEPAHPIHVEARLERDGLLVTITDYGESSDLGTSSFETEDLLPDGLQDGGRGLFLIHSLMDEVEYHVGPAGNVLCMKKVIGADPPDSASA